MAIGINLDPLGDETDFVDMSKAQPLRKGARGIIVHGVPFGWLAGKTTVEIRNRFTNKAYHVPKHRLCTKVKDWDDSEHSVVTPAMVSSFIACNKEEHGLL